MEKTIITESQHQWILARLEQNRLNARRNAKREYLLAGMIHYEGDNLRYHGFDIRHKSWASKWTVGRDNEASGT